MTRRRPGRQIPDGNLTPEPRFRNPSPRKIQTFQLLLKKLPRPSYSTSKGGAFLGDAIDLLPLLPDQCVDLILTSPPFALRRQKAYGNVDAAGYVEWFQPFAVEIHRVLKSTGSLVMELGGAWERGRPVRALYQFSLLHELAKTFRLAQEFYYFNIAKLPTPAEWVTVQRCRLKDAVTILWWMSKSDQPKADNRRVLYPYGLRMENLLRNGYNAGPRPSEHHISHKWARRNRGAISPNILVCPNTVSSDPYLRRCRSFQLQAHPARFPAVLPRFFIRFLTEIGDVVLDPFAGSNVTGREAENNNRHWLAFERDQIYLEGSSLRFFDLPPRRPLAPAAMQTRSASTPPSVP